MKIGVLYIATGRYISFWKQFYKSAEKYLIPDASKYYFVFTDAKSFPFYKNPNVIVIPHKKLGWPYDTLMRFDIFLKAEDELKNMDYIFFFNSNMIFQTTVSAKEFLPDGYGDMGLVAALHPGYFSATSKQFPYERENEKSTAYMANSEGSHYFMGGLNGGEVGAYLKLVHTLKENIQKDLEHGIIARWHDESHINKFLSDKTPKILSPAYGYPEGANLPFKPKILILHKARKGGHDYLRSEGKTSVIDWIRSRIVIGTYFIKRWLNLLMN